MKLIDISFKELFEDVGAVRVARVHYDESGRSLGTAEVVFERRADGVTAQQKYNGLNLDGKAFTKKKQGNYIFNNDSMIRSSNGHSISWQC
jgi:RNA recognition motif-containing protein